MLWHNWEGGRLKRVLPKDLFYEVSDKRMPAFPKPIGILKEDVLRSNVATIQAFIERHIGKVRYSAYMWKYMACEGLNLLNLVLQMTCINYFLGGMFTTYGAMCFNISNMDPEDRSDPMNLVFPKVASLLFLFAMCHKQAHH